MDSLGTITSRRGGALFLAPVLLVSALATAGEPPREKVFITPVRGEGFKAGVLGALLDLEVAAVGRANKVDVVTPDDLEAMLDRERAKDALGCDAVTCAVELGGALGVRYL